LRGDTPPRERVAAEIANIASQIRTSKASIVLGAPEMDGKRLEDHLMAFAADAKRETTDR